MKFYIDFIVKINRATSKDEVFIDFVINLCYYTSKDEVFVEEEKYL